VASKKDIGITSTVPIELIYAAGLRPVDLNNVFIADEGSGALVEEAERAGFPRNMCAWVKGIYAAALRMKVRRVVAVTEGDCSNTHVLMEMLQLRGVELIPFGYPYHRDRPLLRQQMERFAQALGVTMADGEAWKKRLDRVRGLAHRIDELTWRESRVSGGDNALWLVSCSDLMGDPGLYEKKAREFLSRAVARDPKPNGILRLGLIGIPPICQGLHEALEKLGGRVVFNEIPRQFSMPYGSQNLLEQYTRYTYPYDVFARIEDIKAEVERRRIAGLIHYVQSFCFRQVEDVILRELIETPILTLEVDRPGPLEARLKTRIEAFMEMLNRRGQRSEVRG
jgi:benzoyl-CoA reductase/2-hydroxyglutaryl-CoA dehydratase subunit BcrC/BadD/HgdB